MFALRVRNSLIHALRWLVPPLFIIIAACIEQMPLTGKLAQALVPQLSVMVLIAFSIRKMAFMPPWLVFVVILIAELYAGAVPGTMLIPALVVRYILIEQREFFTFAPFFAVWSGAGVLIALFSTLHWMAIVGFHVTLFDPTPILIRTTVSIALYPLASGAVFLAEQVLWPTRTVDERLDGVGVQFLPLGAVMPAAVSGRKKATKSDEQGPRDQLFRRIRRTKAPKPWMEL